MQNTKQNSNTPNEQSKEHAWYALKTKDAFKHLSTQQEGLSSEEASRRFAEYGPNELKAAHRISPWEILLEQFKDVLVIILLIATVFSAFVGEPLDAIVIAIIVLFAVGLGFVQEYRAEKAIDALRQMAAPTAAVLRDGEEVEIPASEVVPGDIVLLRAGDKIPADARLVESVNLQVEEFALTGESLPVEKHDNPIDKADLAVADRKNMVYAGTAATYGRGRAVIVATGMNTEFGKIAQLLQTVESGKTPLQDNLDVVGKNLARAAFIIVAVIVAIGLFRGQPLIEMALFGIALAVAVVPEALPAVVTISLAIGVQRMVKRHALVRRLPAVETLGSTSIICSDKTGTLTKDEMTVRKIFMGGDVFDVMGAGYEPKGEFRLDGSEVQPSEALKHLLTGATLASDSKIVHNETERRWHVKGDPTEGALVVAAAKAGLEKIDLDKKFPRVNEIPFTSEAKRMTTLHQVDGQHIAYSKGAPEIVIESCTRQYSANGEITLDDEGKRQIF